MHLRSVTQREAEEAIQLPIRIPQYPKASSPFSKGKLPYLYRPAELGKIIESDQTRTVWFFKRLCAIQVIIDDPVPYYFRAATGEIRSLDAGCLGYLKSARPSPIRFNTGGEGEITSVEVLSSFLRRQQDIDDLIKKMDARGK